MKKLVLSLLIVLFSAGSAFSMDTLDFTDYDSVDQIESQFKDFNRSVYAGMNMLTWTSADTPTLLGINFNIVAGFGSFEASPAIGIDEDGILPTGAAFQVGFGAAGFEAYTRVLPEVELGSDIKAKIFGFGLEYQLSNLIPVPGFPDIAIFGEYNTLGLKQDREIATGYGSIDSGVDLKFKSTNFGVVISKSLAILRIYGKAGIQSGSTDMMWNQAAEGGITNTIRGDISDSQLAYAFGLSIAGLKAEVGARGSNLGFGLGWGMRF